MIDESLKPISIYRNVIYYKISKFWVGDCYVKCTFFYETNDRFKSKKKYFNLFGKLKHIPNNKLVFSLPVNIENPKYTKEYLKEQIIHHWNEYIKKVEKERRLFMRELEIKRGEII